MISEKRWAGNSRREEISPGPIQQTATAIVINEAAVKFMDMKDPLGKIITGRHARVRTFTVIGVIRDMIMQSPYDPVNPTIYFMDYENVNWIDLKLNPNKSAAESIAKIESIFKKIIPSAPFRL